MLMDMNDDIFELNGEPVENDNTNQNTDIDGTAPSEERAKQHPAAEGARRRRPDGERRPRPSGDGHRRPRPQGEQGSSDRPQRKRRPDDVRRRENSTSSNGKKKKKKWSKKKKALLIAIVIIGFLLIVLGLIVALIYRYINMIDVVSDDDDNFEILSSIPPDENDLKNSKPDSPEDEKRALEEAIRKNMLENAEDLVSDDNVFNILLIGCDARSKTGRGRSDSMILLSINKNTKKVVMTSFLRDTWVNIPGVGNQRLNAAYFFGGPKLLIKTMESNFHIRIDKYVRVNFYSFIDTVDAIDGVDIDVTEEELEYLNDYVKHENKLLGNDPNDNLVKNTGKQTLNGIQALAYARIRYVGTDFARTQRQRTVMNEIFRKAKKLSLIELNDFLEKVLPNVTTNLEKGQIFSLILNASDYLSYERIDQSIPNLGSFKNMVIDGMMVLGIDFEKYNAELKESIYG